MSLGSSGEEKVSRSLSSCSSCRSICLRLFSRFSADTAHVHPDTNTHVCESARKHAHVERYKRKKHRGREDKSITGTIKCVIIVDALKESQKNNIQKKGTGKRREKPAQMKSMLIMGSLCQKHQGNKQWLRKNKHQVKVRSMFASRMPLCVINN